MGDTNYQSQSETHARDVRTIRIGRRNFFEYTVLVEKWGSSASRKKVGVPDDGASVTDAH